MVKIIVNNQSIHVKTGTSLLAACLENGIYVPHLCYLKEVDRQSASCRMCFVEIEGRGQPVTACTETVMQPMVVNTDTPAVRRLQKTALQLLLSVHRVDCKHCPANRHCGLQQIAKYLKVGLKSKKFVPVFKEPEMDSRHPYLAYFPNRCVLCGRCVRICGHHHPESLLTFAKRGFNTVISVWPYNHLATEQCLECFRCVDVCPVGALLPKSKLDAASMASA